METLTCHECANSVKGVCRLFCVLMNREVVLDTYCQFYQPRPAEHRVPDTGQRRRASDMRCA